MKDRSISTTTGTRYGAIEGSHADTRLNQLIGKQHPRPLLEHASHLLHIAIAVVDRSHGPVGMPEHSLDQLLAPHAQGFCDPGRHRSAQVVRGPRHRHSLATPGTDGPHHARLRLRPSARAPASLCPAEEVLSVAAA